MAIDLDSDSFNQLYQAPAATPARPFSEVLGQARMPARGTRQVRNQAEGEGVESMISRLVSDTNRPETAETPWVGQLDPFGDV